MIIGMNREIKIYADELRVGDVLVDWHGTDKHSCDARVTWRPKSTIYGPFGKTRPGIDIYAVPVDPSVPDSPFAGPFTRIGPGSTVLIRPREEK
jgi:hypothetical protein